MPRSHRERQIQDKDVFLEQCSSTNGLWELEFTQRRTKNGPGHSARGELTTDFSLAEGAGFGEQAAAIWSPSGFLAVQYNHHGVRPSGIRAYLEGFLRDHTHFTYPAPIVVLRPVLDQEVNARLLRSQHQLRLECAVSVDRLTENLPAENIPLGAAMRLHNQTSAGRVEIAVSYGAGKRGGSLCNIKEIADSLLGFTPCLLKLRVAIKEDLDTATEVLDLLEHRETAIVPDRELEATLGRRYTYKSRIHAIRIRFEPWLSQRSRFSAGGPA